MLYTSVITGPAGDAPYINMQNKNWMLNGVDLGVKAEGVTPQIEPVTKH
jgi:hypothetical protein